MAIHAIDFNGVACFSVQFPVAVTVLLKVTVNAVHSFFQVDIFQVYSLLELVRIVKGDLLVAGIEKIALAIVLEDRAENPSVTVEVGKLRVLEVFVKFGRPRLFEKINIRPVAANRAALGIARLYLLLLLRIGTALLFGIHLVAVDFVIPPGVAEISCHHVGAGMDVANNALARWNGSSELMSDGMTRLGLRNGRVGGC